MKIHGVEVWKIFLVAFLGVILLLQIIYILRVNRHIEKDTDKKTDTDTNKNIAKKDSCTQYSKSDSSTTVSDDLLTKDFSNSQEQMNVVESEKPSKVEQNQMKDLKDDLNENMIKEEHTLIDTSEETGKNEASNDKIADNKTFRSLSISEDLINADPDFPPIPLSLLVKPHTEIIGSFFDLTEEEKFDLLSLLKRRKVENENNVVYAIYEYIFGGQKTELKENLKLFLTFSLNSNNVPTLKEDEFLVYKKLVIMFIDKYIKAKELTEKLLEESEEDIEPNLHENTVLATINEEKSKSVKTNPLEPKICDITQPETIQSLAPSKNEIPKSPIELSAENDKILLSAKFKDNFHLILENVFQYVDEIDVCHFELVNCCLNTLTIWFTRLEVFAKIEEKERLMKIYNLIIINIYLVLDINTQTNKHQ